jgi:O-antigen/teichoic acid export membrane protein
MAAALRAVLELGTSVVLARLLLPADFGIIAVGQAFLQLSYVVGNLGMGPAIVQASRLSIVDRRAATTISLFVATLLTLACIIAAPWVAIFFAMPILRVAMPIMAGEMILSGAAATPIALLRRDLQYQRGAIVEIGAGVLYAVMSITMAWCGYGLWSLVWTPWVASSWTLLASHLMARYRPGLSFDRQALRRLLGFGGSLTIKNLFVHLARHSDNLVVAKFLGESATGLYTRAFSLSTLPQTRLVALIYSVAFPAFCRLRDDRERFHAWYVKTTSVAAVVVTPILLGLVAVAPEFTRVVYGASWTGMATSLRILSVAGLLTSLHMLGGAAIEASGRLRYEVAAQAIYGGMIPCGALLGARYGIEGVSTAVLVAAVVFYATKAVALRKAIDLPIRSFIHAALPALSAGAVMCVVVSAVLTALRAAPETSLFSAPLPRLLAGTLLGAAVYAACLLTFGRSHLRVVKEQVDAFRGRRLDPASGALNASSRA